MKKFMSTLGIFSLCLSLSSCGQGDNMDENERSEEESHTHGRCYHSQTEAVVPNQEANKKIADQKVAKTSSAQKEKTSFQKKTVENKIVKKPVASAI